MNLPFKLPFLGKKSEEEYYLALVLRDEKISALIFKQQFEKVTVISKNEINLTETLEKIPLDTLVSILDKVITHAETRLPADIEIKDTVFGVKDSWVIDKKISKDYLARLKHVCSELSLTPIGFIVLSEAIAHLIQQEEAAPVTALITEIGKYMVTVSLFRAGKLIETVDKPILETPMNTVDTALKEFNSIEILPSRIILFQSDSSIDSRPNDLSQKFIAHQWSKTLPFLQIPQISILPDEFDGKAIVAGAAAQLGYTLASLPEDIKHPEIKTLEPKHSRIVNKTESEIESKTEKAQEGMKAANFGFVLDKDIATLSDLPETDIDKYDLKQTGETNSTDKKAITENENADFKPTPELKINDNLHTKAKAKKRFSLAFIPLFLSKIKKNIPAKILSGRKIIVIPPLIILLLIGLTVLYYFQLKATVTLYVSPKAVSETEKITLSTKLDNDFTQNIIAAKDITVSLQGSASTDATGEKEVGDKAKGTVTLFNSDTDKKTFKAGTILTSEKGFTYVMDKEVNVASASGDIFTGIKSGTAQVTITAGKIGTEYNLQSNSKFSIEGTDTVAAKNDAALTGGTKKKVTVVTEKDVEKLKTDLPKELQDKAKEELRKKLGANEELLTDFTQIQLTGEELDHEIDTETKIVKLTGTVNFKSIAYDKDDLLKFAQESLKAKYTKENLSENNIDTKLSGIKDKNETELTGVAAINAGLLPKIEIDSIKNDLKGKSFKDAENFTKNISSQINNVDIKLFPNLPLLPQVMPQKGENINIVVQSS